MVDYFPFIFRNVEMNFFWQMSFVNSIATTKGGRHVDHVSKIIENSLAETLKKKNKGGIVIKPHQVSPFFSSASSLSSIVASIDGC